MLTLAKVTLSVFGASTIARGLMARVEAVSRPSLIVCLAPCGA